MARLTLILGVLATVVYLLGGMRLLLNEWRLWRKKGTWMAVLLCCLVPTTVLAEDLYVGQSDAGLADGTSCANQHSASWFNTAANWGGGAGEIDPGDTVHLCGTITSTLGARLPGSSGNPITILWETDAKLSQARCPSLFDSSGCFDTNSHAFLVLDGGANGLIENTDNGTSPTYSNQLPSAGVYARGTDDLEIKNLTIINMYVHTVDLADDVLGANYGFVNGVSFGGSRVHIHDNTIHDTGWAISQIFEGAPTTIEIDHNTIWNSSHGVTIGGSTVVTGSNILIHHNHVYDYSNWDTNSNAFHHDGIHLFAINGGVMNDVDIYNNRFDGNCGDNMSGHIFSSGGDGGSPVGVRWERMRVFNNVMSCSTVVNGQLWITRGSNFEVYNNTVIGNSGAGACVKLNDQLLLRFVNNALSSCQLMFSMDPTSTFTTVADDLNYNTYANVGGQGWNWIGVCANCSPIATWRAACGCDGNSTENASLNVNALGQPEHRLSPVVDAGTSLASLGIPLLTLDRLGVPRPQLAAWDTGAYEFIDTAPSPVTIGRVLRWMELLLPVAGLGWHYRRAVLAGTLAVCSMGLSALHRVPDAGMQMKALTYQVTLKTVTRVNAWMERKDL